MITVNVISSLLLLHFKSPIVIINQRLEHKIVISVIVIIWLMKSDGSNVIKLSGFYFVLKTNREIVELAFKTLADDC